MWLWGSHGIYVQIIALILMSTLVGSIALLKMQKAESLESIKGEFGIEADPRLDDEVVTEANDAKTEEAEE